MPRWRRTNDSRGKATPGDAATPPAQAAAPFVESPGTETAGTAAADEPTIVRRDTVASAGPQTAPEPRGVARGGELERALAANHDGGISSMSLVGAEGGLRQTAWVFAESERMADGNESEAIAQRVVDANAMPLSFEPEAFYDSLASLMSFREQGGFDSAGSESASSAFPSLAEATSTYPPFGSPQTRGASASGPAFDAQPARRRIERAVDARFASQTSAPPAASGLVFEGGSFSAPLPAERPAQPRGIARWSADLPTVQAADAAALVAPPSAATAPVQRLADRAEPPSPPRAASHTDDAGAPDPARPVAMAPSRETEQDLPLKNPQPTAAGDDRSAPGGDDGVHAPRLAQRAPEGANAAPPSESPLAPSSPVSGDGGADSTESIGEASGGVQAPPPATAEVARTMVDSPATTTAPSPEMPLAASPPAGGPPEPLRDETPGEMAASSEPLQASPHQSATPSSASAQRTVVDNPSGEPERASREGDTSPIARPVRLAPDVDAIPVSPILQAAAESPASDLPLVGGASPVSQAPGPAGPLEAVLHRSIGEAPARESATPGTDGAAAVERIVRTDTFHQAPEDQATVSPARAASGAAGEQALASATDGDTPSSASATAPAESTAQILRATAGAAAPPQDAALELTLAELMAPAGQAASEGVADDGPGSPTRAVLHERVQDATAGDAEAARPQAATPPAAPGGADASASGHGVPAAGPTSQSQTSGAIARTLADANPHAPANAPELTLHQPTLTAGETPATVRRRFDPLRFLRRATGPAERSDSPRPEGSLPGETAAQEAERAAPAPLGAPMSAASSEPTLVSRMPAAPESPAMPLATPASDATSVSGATGSNVLSRAASAGGPGLVTPGDAEANTGSSALVTRATPPSTAGGERESLPLQRTPGVEPAGATEPRPGAGSVRRSAATASPPIPGDPANASPALTLATEIGTPAVSAQAGSLTDTPGAGELPSRAGDGASPAATSGGPGAAMVGQDASVGGIAVPATPGGRAADGPVSLDLPPAPQQRASGAEGQALAALQRQPSAPAAAPTVATSRATPSGEPLLESRGALDLAAPASSSAPSDAGADAAGERALQRSPDAFAPTVPSERTPASAMATPGAPVLDRESARLDLPVPTVASGAVEARMAAPGAEPSHDLPPTPAIARAIATPSIASAAAALPLSLRTNAGFPVGTRTTEPGLFERASEPAPAGDLALSGSSQELELATEQGGARRPAEVNRSVAATPSTSTGGRGNVAIDQPLVAAQAATPPEASGATPSVAPLVAGPDRPAPQMLQRSPEMPLTIEQPAEGLQRTAALEAYGAITSVQRAEDEQAVAPAISEENLEQITEHVWQFVRKELRVERERQRGQA